MSDIEVLDLFTARPGNGVWVMVSSQVEGKDVRSQGKDTAITEIEPSVYLGLDKEVAEIEEREGAALSRQHAER
jgi:hypothetical protein